jgi:hypothetical protein
VAKITVDGAGGTAPDTDNGDKPMIPVSGHCVVECHLQML